MRSIVTFVTSARLFLTLSVGFVLSQFLRASVGVIAPDLSRDLDISPEELGVLTGAFFLTFAAMQMPVGILLDRIGPRLTITGFVVFVIIGAVGFGFGENIIHLSVARALMGLGCASLLMAALVTYARWFPPDRFATVSSLQMGVGYIGTVAATAPLALLTAVYGWRAVFVVVAGLYVAYGVAVFLTLQDAPPGHPFLKRPRESLRESLAGVASVLAQPALRRILALQFFGYASYFSIIGLWGGPYLSDIYGLGLAERGNVLFIMALAGVSGTLAFGPLDRLFDTRKYVVIFGVAGIVTSYLGLIFIPDLALWQVTVLFAAIAALSGYQVVTWAHARAILPEHLIGRGITAANTASMTGVAVVQMITGFIVGAFPTVEGAAPLIAYNVAFGFLALALFAVLLIYLPIEDKPPSSDIYPTGSDGARAADEDDR